MEPEGVKLTYDNEAAVHPQAAVAKVELDDEGYQWVEALRVARRARSAADRDEKRVKAEVAHRLGDAEEGWWRGAPVVTWRNDRPGHRFDIRTHRAAKPECDAEFSIPTIGARRMLPVGADEEDSDG
jgi:hypothetical protein